MDPNIVEMKYGDLRKYAKDLGVNLSAKTTVLRNRKLID